MPSYLPKKLQIQITSVLSSKVDDSDPFAYGRMKSELQLDLCAQGDPWQVEEDMKRINEAREKNKTFDHVAAANLKKHLGFK